MAQQHGVDTEALLSHLVGLLAKPDHLQSVIDVEPGMDTNDNLAAARRRVTSTSHPQLNHGTMGRRHFSFEPGDDQLTETNLRHLQMTDSLESISRVPRLPQFMDSSSDSLSDELAANSLDSEPHKASKIPTPVQLPLSGYANREDSASSLQTVSVRPLLKDDGRRDSRYVLSTT